MRTTNWLAKEVEFFAHALEFEPPLGQRIPESGNDNIQNTCLHYINELELVLCHTRLCLLHDEYHPTQLSLPIHCLQDFHILIFAKLLSSLLLLQSLQNCYYYLPPLLLHPYYFATKYFLQILSLSGVVELTTHLLILENILWLALC